MTANDYKECGTCKQEKHVDEFYKRHNGNPLGDCKECHKARSRNQIAAPRQVAVNFSEQLVIERLSRIGIPTLPGKTLGYKWADVVSWGCVLIECKYSSDKGGWYQWGFSPIQREQGIRAHLIILCSEQDGQTDYYVFDANDPVFTKRSGKRKTAVIYIANAKHRKNKEDVLTKEIMTRHKDAWSLIEHYRCQVSARLMDGDRSLLTDWRVK